MNLKLIKLIEINQSEDKHIFLKKLLKLINIFYNIKYIQSISNLFQIYFKSISNLFQIYFKSISNLFQIYFKSISNKILKINFQKNLKNISRVNGNYKAKE